MQSLGIEPDKIILASVLWACGSLGALDYGRWVHEYIDRNGIKWDVDIGTSLIDSMQSVAVHLWHCRLSDCIVGMSLHGTDC
ncbi:hypothetical protein EV1_041484 [Malus domestica]